MQLGIGVIGVGVRGQHSYELALARHPACTLRAVSQYPDVSPAMLEGKDLVGHARQYARQHGAIYCDDCHDVLERDDVHVVSLMCEPRCAPALVEACCRAGKHIVRDKPMALDLAGADRIVNAVDRSGVKMLVTLKTRFAPNLRLTRQRVRDGAVGRVLTAAFTYLQAGGPLEGFTATQAYLDSVGGGEVTNFGHYAIDYLLWTLAEPVETVYAQSASAFYGDYRSVGMEDLGHVTLRFADGVVATMITGRTTTQSKPASYFRVDITGTAGAIACHGPESCAVLTNAASQPIGSSPPPVEAMVQAFVQAVAANEPSPIDARDGRRVLEVLQAAYTSATEGREVSMGAGASS